MKCPDVDERDDNGKAYYNNNKFCIFILKGALRPAVNLQTNNENEIKTGESS